ncbi:MAG: CD225/dispanin family protein [Flavisolibacter sp.]|nr:CD225/dispanin family protein [Flavisolibacter sp.]
MERNEQQPLLQPPPKNWLVESILVTIFCCIPFGIVGIINAAKVNSRMAVGDYNGALNASQEAAKWTKLGFWIGIGIIALYIIAVFLFGMTAIWTSTRRYDY